MIDEALKLFLDKGLLGAVVLILLFALRHIFMLYVASMEKRVGEAVENKAAIERNTAAMTALVEVVKAKG